MRELGFLRAMPVRSGRGMNDEEEDRKEDRRAGSEMRRTAREGEEIGREAVGAKAMASSGYASPSAATDGGNDQRSSPSIVGREEEEENHFNTGGGGGS